MSDEFEYRFELLKQEMATLQDGIKTYDGILFTIKGWAITIFSAFIFFAADKQKPIFLVICAVAVMLFWLLDAIYKSIQGVYIHRYNQIEEFLRSPQFTKTIQERSFNDFSISRVGASFKVGREEKFKTIFRAALMLHNFVLYVAMLILIVCVSILMR